jgi:hypothetical protein
MLVLQCFAGGVTTPAVFLKIRASHIAAANVKLQRRLQLLDAVGQLSAKTF